MTAINAHSSANTMASARPIRLAVTGGFLFFMRPPPFGVGTHAPAGV